jgi:hypothetical protein
VVLEQPQLVGLGAAGDAGLLRDVGAGVGLDSTCVPGQPAGRATAGGAAVVTARVGGARGGLHGGGRKTSALASTWPRTKRRASSGVLALGQRDEHARLALGCEGLALLLLGAVAPLGAPPVAVLGDVHGRVLPVGMTGRDVLTR